MPSQPGPQADRIRAFIDEQPAFSDTAPSLAHKLGMDVRVVRRVLEELAEAGEVHRRSFERGIESVYFRYRAKAC